MSKKKIICSNRLCKSKAACGAYTEPVGEYAWQYDKGIKRKSCSRYFPLVDKGYWRN